LELKENKKGNVRLSVTIRGAVQGVGFRPFVYRLALEMMLRGWVSNTPQGVFIEVEGGKDILDSFLLRLQKEIPPQASIQSLEFSFLDPVGFKLFEIRKSDSEGPKTTLILPDIATCPDCLKEIFDSSNRRHLYPFTNCTNCGPRFSIIKALPYDRPNTSMDVFQMCPECQSEYDNPKDRRFHAQPNACPACGPQLELRDDEGNVVASRQDALLQTAQAIREGKIIALKGLGGFHLVADARNDEAVRRLRERKHREEKPFAVMFPTLDAVKEECEVNEFEARLLLSPESPIVLLRKKLSFDNDPLKVRRGLENFSNLINPDSKIASSVSPRNPYVGIMLPYTPLHHILMKELGFPVVATSGNISDEPICIEEREASIRLHKIADMYLVHNRSIVRHVDDSIVRVILGRELVLRRARGYAPLPIQLGEQSDVSLLAVGAHLKNTVAITSGNNVFISQHIGDLETNESLTAFRKVISDFQSLYETKPTRIVCDLHPDYLSSQFARLSRKEVSEIQHHYAHIASCMAENQLEGEVVGVSWDGTGFGPDKTIWGGEFLLTTTTSYARIATFCPFPLPGGEKAIKEPRRAALGVLYQIMGDSCFGHTDIESIKSFTKSELDLIRQMLSKMVNTPFTSSVGRLFDAVASLIGLRHFVNYEGQAAMELEFLIAGMSKDEISKSGRYEFELGMSEDKPLILIQWSSMLNEIINDVRRQISASLISIKFHNTLIEIIVEMARQIGQQRIVLSGGCFQNRYLIEGIVNRLREEGFLPYCHQRVPPNDGGISLGQVYAAKRSNEKNVN
jgi:hydrogenase maturation protein HypF